MMTYQSKSKQRGITIIEVLVAMLILAVGLLGMASLQVRAVSDTTNASFRSIAIFYANDMADRIRANPAGEQGNLYNSVAGNAEKSNCKTTTGCNFTDMAAHDKWEWLQAIGNALPGGTGTLSKSGDEYTVTVSWNTRSNVEDAGGNQQTMETSSVNFSFEP